MNAIGKFGLGRQVRQQVLVLNFKGVMMETNFILLITFENNRVTWFYENLDDALRDKDFYFKQAKERGIVDIEVFEKIKALK